MAVSVRKTRKSRGIAVMRVVHTNEPPRRGTHNFSRVTSYIGAK
jgi:hypothetical protein